MKNSTNSKILKDIYRIGLQSKFGLRQKKMNDNYFIWELVSPFDNGKIRRFEFKFNPKIEFGSPRGEYNHYDEYWTVRYWPELTDDANIPINFLYATLDCNSENLMSLVQKMIRTGLEELRKEEEKKHGDYFLCWFTGIGTESILWEKI